MDKEAEIALLRTLIEKHMDEGNYHLASRYLYLVEEIETGGDQGTAVGGY